MSNKIQNVSLEEKKTNDKKLLNLKNDIDTKKKQLKKYKALVGPLSLLWKKKIEKLEIQYNQEKLNSLKLFSPAVEDIEEKDIRKMKGFNNFYLGVNENYQPLYINNINQHLSVFGGSGSGKSVFLFGLLNQVIRKGGGACMIDGKGDLDMLQEFIGHARELGREKDVLVLSFDKGSKSNTFNIFKSLPLEEIKTIISNVAIGKTDDFFKQQTAAFLETIFGILSYLEKKGDPLSLKILIQALNLKVLIVNLIPASKTNPNEPDQELLELNELTEFKKFWVNKEYYKNGDIVSKVVEDFVGGYGGKIWKTEDEKEEDSMQGVKQIPEELQKQIGGYSAMYIKTIDTLSKNFNSILNAPKNDIDFKDIISQNKLIYVKVPSMKLSEDEKSSIGAFVIASIKNAIAEALGDEIEIEKETAFTTLNKEQRTSNPKFLLVLDEMAEFFSKSKNDIGIIFSQARSVEIGIVVSTQDVASLSTGTDGMNFVDKMLGNSFTKVFLKTTDTSTLEKMKAIIRDRYYGKIDEEGKEIEEQTKEIEEFVKGSKNGLGVAVNDNFTKFCAPYIPAKKVTDFKFNR